TARWTSWSGSSTRARSRSSRAWAGGSSARGPGSRRAASRPKCRACGDAPLPLHSWWTSTATGTSTSFPVPTPAWTRTWRDWFKGQGKGKFAPKPELILAGDKPLKLPGAHSDPFLIDWDGDGDLDLISGCSDGGVYLAENKAGKGKPPEFLPFRPLIKPRPAV